MAPLAIAALIGAGLFGGWKLLAPKATIRFVGDYAKIGDTIQVAPDFLMTSQQIPWPKGKPLWVAIEVLGADKDRIQGPIVGYEYLPQIPAKLGSFTVMRSAIFKVIRNGKTVADAPGASTMTGEG